MTESNIRNVQHFKEGFWEWAPYNDCFLTVAGKDIGIRVSDIDGHVERNGHFLWLEATRNNVISTGQFKSLRARVQRGDTVVVLHGPPNEALTMQIFRPSQDKGETMAFSQSRLQRFFRGWMLWAEANGWVNPGKIGKDGKIDGAAE